VSLLQLRVGDVDGPCESDEEDLFILGKAALADPGDLVEAGNAEGVVAHGLVGEGKAGEEDVVVVAVGDGQAGHDDELAHEGERIDDHLVLDHAVLADGREHLEGADVGDEDVGFHAVEHRGDRGVFHPPGAEEQEQGGVEVVSLQPPCCLDGGGGAGSCWLAALRVVVVDVGMVVDVGVFDDHHFFLLLVGLVLLLLLLFWPNHRDLVSTIIHLHFTFRHFFFLVLQLFVFFLILYFPLLVVM